MSHTTSLYLAQIDAHVFAAQAISLHMSKVATGPLNKLITAYANAIGSPSEFIFFPLLSIAAHFTGPSTRVMINKDWLEPLILWNVVLADKGQKKSPALNRFVKPIQQLEVNLNDADDAGNDDDDENHSRQIYIEHFSMKELHYTLKRNDGRVVGLYNKISLLYEQLDKYKSGNSDRNTFLSLINGSPWRRNFRTSHSIVPRAPISTSPVSFNLMLLLISCTAMITMASVIINFSCAHPSRTSTTTSFNRRKEHLI